MFKSTMLTSTARGINQKTKQPTRVFGTAVVAVHTANGCIATVTLHTAAAAVPAAAAAVEVAPVVAAQVAVAQAAVAQAVAHPTAGLTGLPLATAAKPLMYKTVVPQTAQTSNNGLG